MKTVEHKLLSIPGESMDIPEETLEHIEQFFKITKSSRNEVILEEKMDKDAYFSGMDENMRKALMHNNYVLKKYNKPNSKDIIYAIIGHYDCTIESARIDKIADEIDMKFDKILRIK
jgi:hypothetical protein